MAKRKQKGPLPGRAPADFVRRFPENGMKLLLEDPRNTHDLLRLSDSQLIPWIDFTAMTRVGTTFVQHDYRNLECDVVLTAPFRPPDLPRLRKILLWILIEHQSRPDIEMPLRLLEYVLEIYRYQERQRRRDRPGGPLRLMPVLPVVFYTGTRTWESVGRFVDLVAHGSLFGKAIPTIEPIFLNLRAIPEERLTTAGGWFGHLLHVVQQRTLPLDAFKQLVQEEVQALDGMPGAQWYRWLELLSYLAALVYHDRDPAEHSALHGVMEKSVAAGREQREVADMAKSMAEVLMEEGARKALQRTLLQQLRQRFHKVPAEIQSVVQATEDIEQLEQWLAKVLSAKTIDKVGIHADS